jgi:hypothetical protein
MNYKECILTVMRWATKNGFLEANVVLPALSGGTGLTVDVTNEQQQP